MNCINTAAQVMVLSYVAPSPPRASNGWHNAETASGDPLGQDWFDLLPASVDLLGNFVPRVAHRIADSAHQACTKRSQCFG
jgi:hypothetical protein